MPRRSNRFRRVATFATLVLLVAGGILGLAQREESGPGPGAPGPSTEPTYTNAGGTYLDAACALPSKWVKYINRGWDRGRKRNWDIILVPKEENYVGTFTSTSHAGPFDHLQEVPLIFYGPGHIEPRGEVKLRREITLADIAPTQAKMIGTEFDSQEGRAIVEILERGSAPPKVIVLASIDGGGWNVLRHWSSAWPNMAVLIETGASVEGVVVGSSPSITPPAHTNMSTGVFPRTHGVVAIGVRNDEGDVVGGFAPIADTGGATLADPTINLRTKTLGDVWDAANDNQAEVALVAAGNYALGMLGFGGALKDADKDIAAMSTPEKVWKTNPRFYSVPNYVNDRELRPDEYLVAVDRSDGKLDDKWLGHEIPLEAGPALAPWTNDIATTILDREGFGEDNITDLLYVHYKSPDIAGHHYNMLADEMGPVIASVDEAIGDLVQWLDENIGSRRYVLIVTADHGQTPLDPDAWAISRSEMIADLVETLAPRSFDDELVERTTPTTLLMNRAGMRRLEVTPEEISDFLTDYTIEQNMTSGAPSDRFEDRLDETVFAAVFPARQLPEVIDCVRGND